jgi:hypothetical protein
MKSFLASSNGANTSACTGPSKAALRSLSPVGDAQRSSPCLSRIHGETLGLFMSCGFIKQSKPISGLSTRSRRVENDPPPAAPALETKSNSMRWPMPCSGMGLANSMDNPALPLPLGRPMSQQGVFARAPGAR